MFHAQQKATGTGYTTTATFLVVAFVFSPAVLVLSRPAGYLSVALAVACSALCVALAWLNWRKSSQLSIPSIATRAANSK
jgi:hypothetical protein